MCFWLRARKHDCVCTQVFGEPTFCVATENFQTPGCSGGPVYGPKFNFKLQNRNMLKRALQEVSLQTSLLSLIVSLAKDVFFRTILAPVHQTSRLFSNLLLEGTSSFFLFLTYFQHDQTSAPDAQSV